MPDAHPRSTVWLRRPLDTFHRAYWTGDRFEAAAVGVDDLWDLYDAGGVLRVSHCRGEVISFEEIGESADGEFGTTGIRRVDDDHSHQSHEQNAPRGEYRGSVDHVSSGELVAGDPHRRDSEVRSTRERAESCPFDPNVELQLTREPRHAAPVVAPPTARRTFSWDDLPNRPGGGSAPIIYGRGVVPESWIPSEGHSRLAEWSGWQISGYGTQIDERVVFCALAPGATSWRFYVDLDRGEWQDWGGAWQPLNSEPTITEAAGPAPASNPAIDEPTDQLCQCGEYPEPSASWNVDQLRGWRTVRDRDGTVCGHFGPDRPEDTETWKTWLTRVQAFSAGLEVRT